MKKEWLILLILVVVMGCVQSPAPELSAEAVPEIIEEVYTKQIQGLGGRAKIREKEGMLFDFGKKGEYSFWMKDMQVDLDILWINEGKIVHIAKNVSHDSLETINPKIEADKVLEINSGLSDKYNFKIGDSVKIY